VKDCFVIAEAGVNHNGSLDMALELVDAAARAGADAVKFQTFRASALVTRSVRKARYQQETTGGAEGQHEMLRRLELDEPAHVRLQQRAAERGIEFLSTPFDVQALAYLVDLGVRRIKVSSGDVTNAPLLLAAARTGLPVIVSTGMCRLGEVEDALGVLAFGYVGGDATPGLEGFQRAYASEEGRAALSERVTVLHCTSAYPAPLAEVNLRAMSSLAQAFPVAVGYSDHTTGIAVAIAAAARGARLLEKHFTLDRALPGPDHRASLLPDELAALVQGVRDVGTALGSATKAPTPSEVDVRAVARKVLVAARPIAAGATIGADDVAAKRAGQGLSPMHLWSVLGTTASRSYETDEPLLPPADGR
jgi:N-acetylneuraminate synthase